MPLKTDENNPADWFLLAKERLSSADSLWKNDGLTYTGVEALQEGVERLLKGYLVANGWQLKRTQDLERLIKDAEKFDARFASFLPFAEELTEDFFAQHYPGMDIEEVGKNYEQMRIQAGELIQLIQAGLPQYFT